MARTKFTNPMDNKQGLGNPSMGSGSIPQGGGRSRIGGLKPDTGYSGIKNNENAGYQNMVDGPINGSFNTEITNSGLYDVPVRQIPLSQQAYNHGSTECVYSIRSIVETDLTNYSFFSKVSEGIPPFFCNVKYNLSLVEKDTGTHEGRGQQLNAVIYGKLIDAPLMPQDLVRVKGHYRGGVYVVKKLYSENYGQYVRISRTWKNQDRKSLNDQGQKGPLPFFLVGLVFLIALIFIALTFLPVSVNSGSIAALKTAVFAALIIVVVLVGLYLNRFQIFLSKPFLIVFLLTIAVLVAKYIPGGEGLVTEIATIVITIIGLIMIVKSIFR